MPKENRADRSAEGARSEAGAVEAVLKLYRLHSFKVLILCKT